MWIAKAGLGTVAVAGALLTLGLIQRWGEVYPRWIVGLAGQRVPPPVAIVPATLISIFVTSAGLAYVRLFLALGRPGHDWATIGPELLWQLWGTALAGATRAYYLRRRHERTISYQEERGD